MEGTQMAHTDDTRPIDGGLSPAPGTPQTATKAIWGAVSTLLLAFLTALLPYLTDNAGLTGIPAEGWVTAVIAALASGGITGAVVYQKQNQPI
jgi:hypothetical protein